MALSSKSIGDGAGQLLNDMEAASPHLSWTIPELATWINAGCREIVLLKPTALTASVAVGMQGGTKQSLAGATFRNTGDGSAVSLTPLQLLDGVRNLGATGTEAGQVVRVVERKTLDVMLPGWHMAAGAAAVRFLMFDPKNPLGFFVYPRPITPLYLEVVVSRAPVNALLDTASVLGTGDIDAGLLDIYESALVDYVLYRAWLKDVDSPSGLSRAQGHYRAFATALGVKLQNEVGFAPRQARQAAAVPVAAEGGP